MEKAGTTGGIPYTCTEQAALVHKVPEYLSCSEDSCTRGNSLGHGTQLSSSWNKEGAETKEERIVKTICRKKGNISPSPESAKIRFFILEARH